VWKHAAEEKVAEVDVVPGCQAFHPWPLSWDWTSNDQIPVLSSLPLQETWKDGGALVDGKEFIDAVGAEVSYLPLSWRRKTLCARV